MLSLHRPIPAVVAVLLCFAGDGDAQDPRGLGAEALRTVLERGDELHARMRPTEALEAYRSVLAEDPDHPGALVRASRECAVLGRLVPDDDDASEWLREADSLAREAVAAAPEAPRAHYRLAAALQARAERNGVRQRIQRAKEAHREATFVLDRDPGHAGAHHVLGRWHAGLARLQGFPRFLARHVLGESLLQRASWEDAVLHLERAVKEAPESLTFRLSLAEVYLARNRVGEARVQLREILERPSVHPADPQVKQSAQELLKENP